MPIGKERALLTESELKILERSEAATQGPWVYTDIPQVSRTRKLHWIEAVSWGLLGNFDHGESKHTSAKADAIFVASAREDIPALLATIVDLRATVKWFEMPVIPLNTRWRSSVGRAADL